MPQSAPNGMRPTAPPRTQATMSRVSEWANALARTCSSTRSWIEASTASFARPLAIAVTRHSRATAPRESRSAAMRATNAASAMPIACSRAGRWMRRRVPMAWPGTSRRRARGHDHDRHLIGRLPGTEADRQRALLDRERQEQGQEPISARRVALPIRAATTTRPERTLAPRWLGRCRTRGTCLGRVRVGAGRQPQRGDHAPEEDDDRQPQRPLCAELARHQADRQHDRAGERAEDRRAGPCLGQAEPLGSTRGTAALRATP